MLDHVGFSVEEVQVSDPSFGASRVVGVVAVCRVANMSAVAWSDSPYRAAPSNRARGKELPFGRLHNVPERAICVMAAASPRVYVLVHGGWSVDGFRHVRRSLRSGGHAGVHTEPHGDR